MDCVLKFSQILLSSLVGTSCLLLSTAEQQKSDHQRLLLVSAFHVGHRAYKVPIFCVISRRHTFGALSNMPPLVPCCLFLLCCALWGVDALDSTAPESNDVLSLTSDTFADTIERQTSPALVRFLRLQAGTRNITTQQDPASVAASLTKDACCAFGFLVQLKFVIADCQPCAQLEPEFRKVASNLKVRRRRGVRALVC